LPGRSPEAFGDLRLAALLLLTAACGSPTEPVTTGLSGTVLRGPIAPVCVIALPCEEPFSAGFTVQRGTTRVAAFKSDPQGHFEVRLAPGTYVIIPAADAPIISPSAQSKQLTVGTAGLTTIELHFDTGIR
jgi:hypothetical protein